jgi:hypothetical protein
MVEGKQQWIGFYEKSRKLAAVDYAHAVFKYNGKERGARQIEGAKYIRQSEETTIVRRWEAR